MFDYFLQLLIYVFIAAITPGPNNTIAFYTSFNFGIKQSIHLPIAAALGATIIQFLCCLGLGTILIQFPLIQNLLKFLGFIYLIYLAYQISIFRLSNNQHVVKKIKFIEYFVFQFINPKLFIFASTTSVIFTNYNSNLFLEAFFISLVMGALTISAITIWILAGNILLNIFKNEIQRKITNYFLSASLLLTAIWIILT